MAIGRALFRCGVALALVSLLSVAAPARTRDWNAPGRPGAPAVCFAQGTADRYVAAIEAYLARRYGPPSDPFKYQLANRWPGAQGSNVALTWSLVPDGLSIPGSVGEPTSPSDLFATMNAAFANDTALWIGLIDSCFQRWQDVSGVTFTRVKAQGVEWDDGAPWGTPGDGVGRGDIRIAMHPIDGGGAILGFSLYPSEGDMLLDSAEPWGLATSNYIFMRQIFRHEMGHSLGLNHVCPLDNTKLMEPFLSTAFDGPQLDDVRGVQRSYGDANEDDNTAATATDLGVLGGAAVKLGTIPPPALSNTSRLSIDANSEEDWYAFTTAVPSTLSIVLSPEGVTYPSGAQIVSGCTPGIPVPAKAMADLAFEVRSSAAGNPILASVNAAGLGVDETLADFALAAPGAYFVRILENNAPTQTQLYSLTIDVEPVCRGSVALGGPGCPGSSGCTPALDLLGCPASSQTVTVALSNGMGNSAALLLVGLAPASVSATNGCTLLVGSPLPFVGSFVLGGSVPCQGTVQSALPLPAIMSTATIQVQAACSDPAQPGGFSLSNSLAVTLAP